MGRTTRLTHDEFVNKLHLSIGKEYIPLEHYKNNKTKIKMLHLECGNEYYATPKTMIKENKPTKCPKCYGTPKKDMKILQDEVNEIYGKKYVILTRIYTSNKMDINVKCGDCGNTFITKPYRLTSNKNGCPFCASNCPILFKENSYQQVIDRARGKGNFTLLSEFVGTKQKILVRSNNCGHEFEALPETFLKLKGCKICNGAFKRDTKWFNNKVKELGQGKYELRSEYIKSSAKVKLFHTKCKREYFARADDFIQGKRCPHCRNNKNSLPVKLIYKVLNDNKIYFNTERSFDDLINKKHLHFDINIPDMNLLIEYDGEFHFVNYFSNGERYLTNQQDNDYIKNKYCYDNSISLIRIPYKYKRRVPKIIKLIVDGNIKEIRKKHPLVYICMEKTSLSDFEKEVNKYNGIDPSLDIDENERNLQSHG